jgi:hypothetical protein
MIADFYAFLTRIRKKGYHTGINWHYLSYTFMSPENQKIKPIQLREPTQTLIGFIKNDYHRALCLHGLYVSLMTYSEASNPKKHRNRIEISGLENPEMIEAGIYKFVSHEALPEEMKSLFITEFSWVKSQIVAKKYQETETYLYFISLKIRNQLTQLPMPKYLEKILSMEL